MSPSQPNRKIRIATLLHTTGYGGVDTIVLNWARVLDPALFETILFTFADPNGLESPFLASAARAGYKVRTIPWSRRKPLLKAARSLASQLRMVSADILHCHNPYADFVGNLARRRAGVRTVTTLHAWGESGFRLRVLEWIDAYACRSFDSITVPSQAAFDGAVERGIPASRLRMVGISPLEARALSPGERAGRRQEFGAGADDIVLAIVGRLYPFKNTVLAVNAVGLLAGAYPQLRLWVIGDGPEEPHIRAEVERLGLGSQVRFFGYRTDVSQLLPLAEIQLHTSVMGEGLPLAILEGMRAGLPVVATASGSIPEVVVTGRTGILAGTSAQEVADAIGALAGDRELRERLGAGARDFVAGHYNDGQAAASLASLYSELSPR